MNILKNFLGQFFILIIVIGSIVFMSGNKKTDIIEESELPVDTNIEIKDGSYIKEPKQKNISKEKVEVIISGIDVTMTKLAEYDITGVVMDTEEYNDVIGPIDVGLAWGNLSENDNYKDFTSYVVRNRTLTWTTNNQEWVKKIGGIDVIKESCSNNHLIPANEEIREKMFEIENDQYIRITGYLVDLEWQIGNTKHMWGPSSLSRSDSGDHACEIIYVQTIDFL